MKTNNIFDKMDKDTDELDISTIGEETGVNEDRVKELVMMSINKNEKKTVKKNGKKVFVVLAAAVAATIAVGTVTAGATGSFNSVFAQMFAGEAVDGMFSSSDATVKSDVVDIDFKGVAGDKRQAYAIYNVTKKDGTPFITDENSFLTLTQNVSEDNYVAHVDCTLPLFDKLTEGLFYHPDIPGGDIWYEQLDNNTLQACMQFRDEGRNIIGQTVTIKDDTIVINHIDELLGTHDELFGVDGIATEETEKRYNEAYEYAEKVMKEGQEITLTPDFGLAIVTPEVVNIEYEISFPLNYREITKSYDVQGKTVTYRGHEAVMTSMEALPLSIRLDMYYDVADQDELLKIWETPSDGDDEYIEITVKNGQTYRFDNPPSHSSDNHERVQFDYYGNFKIMTIDPKDIVKINFNGTVLYEK